MSQIDIDRTAEERFVEFQYVEIKDLTKQFLTLIVGTLVLSVSLSDKILPLQEASSIQKCLLGSCWVFLLLALILAGWGIFTNYLAAISAREGSIFGRPFNYRRMSHISYLSLDIGGILFVVALLLFGATGLSRLL